jgi:hypothetical protein
VATTQIIALGVFVLVIAGLVFAFARHGVKIKADPDRNPRSDPPGSGL